MKAGHSNPIRTTKDIVIPAGTRLFDCPPKRGGPEYVEAIVAVGPDFTGYLVLQRHKDLMTSGFVTTNAAGERAA